MKIPLSQGKYAIVDRWHEAAGRPEWLGEGDDPSLLVEIWKYKRWRAVCINSIWYAAASVRLPVGHRRLFLLHSLIMGRQPGEPADGRIIDHIDGDGLNNSSQNLANSKPRNKGTSKFKGVSQNPSGTWRVQISANSEKKYLGCFDSERDAAKAYDWNAVRVQEWEGFARVNFPEIDYLSMPEPPPRRHRRPATRPN